MSSPIPEEEDSILSYGAFFPPGERVSRVHSRVGSVVRIMEPEERHIRNQSDCSTSGLRTSGGTSPSARGLFASSTPRSDRRRWPSQKELVRNARRCSGRRRRKPLSSSLPLSGIKSPYATSSLNWSSYNSPFAFRSPYNRLPASHRSPWSTPGGVTPNFPPWRGPGASGSASVSASGFATPTLRLQGADYPRRGPAPGSASASGLATPTHRLQAADYPGRDRMGSFDLHSTFMNMSVTSSSSIINNNNNQHKHHHHHHNNNHPDNNTTTNTTNNNHSRVSSAVNVTHGSRSVSRLSRLAGVSSPPLVLDQSRVSIELTGNVSIDLRAPRVDAPETPLEAAHPARENLRRARLMSRLIVGLAQGSSPRLDKFFHKFDVDAPYGKKLVSQRSPSVFDVRMFVKNPMPSGYFEIVPTLERNAPAGHVVYRMSKSLTVEDRSLMKDMWGPCLQDDQLTPCTLHPWIAKGVRRAVKELQGIKIGRSTYGFLLSYSPPEVVVIVRAISEVTLVSSVFTLHILPVVMETGRPRLAGLHLRVPLPPVLPYSRAGVHVLRQVESEVEEGRLVWYLEGRHVEPQLVKSTTAELRRWKDRHVACRQSAGSDDGHLHQHHHRQHHHLLPPHLQLHKQGTAAKGAAMMPAAAESSRNWVVSLQSLEKRLLELSLKTAPLKEAKKGFSAFDSLFEDCDELWQVVGRTQVTSLKLWTLKRSALRSRSRDDWLRALLTLLQEAAAKKFATYFLQPSINFLADTDQRQLEALHGEARRHLVALFGAVGSTSTTPCSTSSMIPRTPTQRTPVVQKAAIPRSTSKQPAEPTRGGNSSAAR